MPAPTKYAEGSLSSLTVNGTVWKIKTFKYNQKFDKHDVSMAPNTGKKTPQLGMSEVEFSGEAFLDLSKSPVATFQNGSLVSIVATPDGSIQTFTSSYCVIDNVEYSYDVENVITSTFTGQAGPDYVVA